ncbi:MAG: hypothetical protein ICV56_05555 [Nitrososphaeraceae archaeon]|nr:hypothetical protein [Nitrososphaeraceae archaeon]
MQDINEAKEKINHQDNNNKNNKNIIDNNLDVNNWGEVERMIGGLDNLISLTSLSTEHKKILLMSEKAIYNCMLEKLSTARL